MWMWMCMRGHTHLNHNWTKAILNNKSEYNPLIDSSKKKKNPQIKTLVKKIYALTSK